MSLISDALKTAQRERRGRASSSGAPQPLLDGFFPYVSSSPTRDRRRLTPLLLVSGAAIVVAVVAWVMWPRAGAVTPPVSRPPVAAAPDSAVNSVPADAGGTAEPSMGTSTGDQVVAALPETAQPETPPVERPVITRRDAGAAGARTSPADTITRLPEARTRSAVVRVDYEAQATALFNAGDLDGAREKFELATRLAPTARAWTNYGVTLQRLGDNRGAAGAYQAAIGVDANYLEAWLYQGRLAAELGDVTRAIPLLMRARFVDPGNADVNVELARLESQQKNWTETRRFAEDAIRTDPRNSHGQWFLAIAADGLRDADTAIRAFTAYLANVDTGSRDQAEFVGYARRRLVELRGRP